MKFSRCASGQTDRLTDEHVHDNTLLLACPTCTHRHGQTERNIHICSVFALLCFEDKSPHQYADDADVLPDVCQCTARGLGESGSRAVAAAARRRLTVKTSSSMRRSCDCRRSRGKRSFCSVSPRPHQQRVEATSKLHAADRTKIRSTCCF